MVRIIENIRSLEWLLEPENPGVRFFAMRDLLELPQNDPELAKARKKAYTDGPIATILSKMHPEGYWFKAGPGYSPKYQGTVWSMIMLGQLGATEKDDPRIRKACSYLLANNLTQTGQFSVNGTPSGTVDCLQGNLCTTLTMMGCEDERLLLAYEWMARCVTGEGIAPPGDREARVRYYAYKCGPNFACGVNYSKPCGWGATKVMLAFSYLPKKYRSPIIQRAIAQGIDFLFSVDPATAGYPCGNGQKPSRSWWKFGFPVFYITDILQVVEALARLGYGADRRLVNAMELIHSKQDVNGQWSLEHDYRTWVDIGEKKKPNKWVTLRALRVL